MEKEVLKFYALKESSIKQIILDILSIKWPISVSEIHKMVCSGRDIKISYQAVHKSVKELYKAGCVVQEKNKYQINMEWLRQVSNKLQQIEANYQGEFLFPKTLFQEGKSRVNILIAKEGIVRDRLRDQRLYHLLRELLQVYREEYPTHNIFHRKESEAIEYLLESQTKNELLVFTINNKVAGGTILRRITESRKDNHSSWKLKHFALRKTISEEIEAELMGEIEDRLRKKSNSVKIQLNFSSKEKRYINFFKKYGFKKEGTLKNQYRLGETMYIYSKLFT